MSRNELTEFHRRTAAHIEREGRSIVGVFPVEGEEGDGLALSYTIGNHLKGLPELPVIGTAQGFFLNTLSRLMIAAGHGFKDGETVRTSGGKEVKLIRANAFAREEYTIQAGEHFGHDEYEVMQVLIPDKEGRFPGDEGCEKPYASVPVLRVQ